MLKIIGHRGAAGLALENTQASIEAGLRYADAIEVDVRRTRDGQLVLAHDVDTSGIAHKTLVISKHTLSELQCLELNNGQHLLKLEEALELIGRKPIIIEVKDKNSTQSILRALNLHPKAQVSLTSYHYDELTELHSARPDLPIYARSLWKEHPINLLYPVLSARRFGFYGVSLNQRVLALPFIYWLARFYGLAVFSYPAKVSQKPKNLWTRLTAWLYPRLSVCTDFPDRLQSLRRHSK